MLKTLRGNQGVFQNEEELQNNFKKNSRILYTMDSIKNIVNITRLKNKSIVLTFDNLVKAINDGDTNSVEAFIEAGLCLNDTNDSGETPLILAISKGNYKIAKLLINSKKINLDVTNIYGQTALIKASIKGNDKIAKLLIDCGALLDVQSICGQTALISAIFFGNIEIAKLLIQSGAKLDFQDENGYNALMISIFEGHDEISKMLIDFKTDLDIKDFFGRTSSNIADQERKMILK